MTLCIQCALKALLANEPVPTFEEEPEAHRQRLHGDPIHTALERINLERKLWAKLREETTHAARSAKQEAVPDKRDRRE